MEFPYNKPLHRLTASIWLPDQFFMRRIFIPSLRPQCCCSQAVLALALSLPVLALAQDNAQSKPARADEKNEPTTIQAEQMTGRPDREVFLERDVDIVRGQTRINSDKATYYQEENQVEGEGNVRMLRFGDQYAGDKLKYNIDTGEGWLLKPKYKLIDSNAQGKGERADFEASDRATIKSGTYSTCEGPNPDWYVLADTLKLDSGTDTGNASKAVVYFMDTPILGVPTMSFPLSEGRKSGVLAPTVGTTSTGGLEVMVPYYFNLAPNRDLTLYPKIISKRGFQLGADARYMDQNYFGETKFEVLPNDQQSGPYQSTNRYAISSTHTQKLMPGLSFGWNLNKVSDSNYFSDFTNHFDGLANSLTGLSNASIATSAQRLLSREIGLSYAGANWSANARVTNYQVLQDTAAPLAEQLARPYERLPQLTFKTWGAARSGLDWGVDAEWTRFWLSDSDLRLNCDIKGQAYTGICGDRGDRMILKPHIAYSVLQPGYFITPKLSLHMTNYQLDNQLDGSRSLSRTLPTFSIDSGLVFERDTTLFGKKVTQTLEPRLFYVNTPYRDQSQFPNFDTAEPGFGFAQLFSENRFVGSDRISDANQLTAALVSRYLEPSGAERARFAIGQRFYFNNQRVYLDAPSTESRSDLLLAASGQWSQTLSLDSALQYSLSQHQVSSASVGVQWKPDYKQVLNASYRYLRSDADSDYVGINQINFSGQWPVANRWHAVGLISYSLPDRKVVQGLLGMEYNADCWAFRVVGKRVYTATDNAGSAIFVQLQLNGLSKIGTSALETLRKTIPGYQYQDPNTVPVW